MDPNKFICTQAASEKFRASFPLIAAFGIFQSSEKILKEQRSPHFILFRRFDESLTQNTDSSLTEDLYEMKSYVWSYFNLVLSSGSEMKQIGNFAHTKAELDKAIGLSTIPTLVLGTFLAQIQRHNKSVQLTLALYVRSERNLFLAARHCVAFVREVPVDVEIRLVSVPVHAETPLLSRNSTDLECNTSLFCPSLSLWEPLLLRVSPQCCLWREQDRLSISA